MHWINPVELKYWPDYYQVILPWMDFVDLDSQKTYEWLLLAICSKTHAEFKQQIAPDILKQSTVTHSLAPSEHIELPNLMKNIVQSDESMASILRDEFLHLTQTSECELTPVIRGEMVAHQIMSNKSEKAFDLLNGLSAEDFLDAWEQLESILQLFRYPFTEYYSEINLHNQFSNLDKNYLLLIDLAYQPLNQLKFDELTENTWTHVLAERLWIASELNHVNLNHLDLSNLVKTIQDGAESVSDYSALIMLYIISGQSVDQAFNQLIQTLDKNWEKDQDRDLSKLLRALVLVSRYDLADKLIVKIVKAEFKLVTLLILSHDHIRLGQIQRFPDPKHNQQYMQAQSKLDQAINRAKRLKAKVEFIGKAIKFGLRVVSLIILLAILKFFGVL